MERTAQRTVIFGLAGVLIFGGLVGLWVAASPGLAVPTNGSHASLTVSTLGPTQPGAAGVVAYMATFTETGLPSGTLWFVNLAGQSSVAGTTASLSTLLVNGSYSYTVGSSNTSFVSTSNAFTVSGAPVGMSVGFTPAAPPPAYVGPTIGGVSYGEVVAAVIGVLVVAAVALVIVQMARSHRPMSAHRPPAA